jgi:SseB protein C-terminal domain
MTEPVVSPLVYRIADTTVLIGLRFGDRGPEPLYTEVGGVPAAVAYTDPDEIRRDLPDGYRLFQLQVPELLGQLPPPCGLVINPRADSPLFVAPEERDLVVAAGQPFPPGAYIRVQGRAERPERLLSAALPRLAAVRELRRLYCTRYRVADAREKLLLVYEADAGGDDAVNDALLSAAAEAELPDPMQVIALEDIPEEFRRVVLSEVEPCYER